MKKNARPLGDVLSEFMKSSGLSRRRRLSAVEAGWARAAGEAVAAHSRVAALRAGALTVVVDSAACRHELANFRRFEMLERLRGQKGCERIHDIRFKVGSLESG